MEICGTVIKTDEIIGISNLEMGHLVSKNKDFANVTMRLQFFILTKQNRIPITSDISAIGDQVKAQKEVLEFQMMYIKHYKEVFRLINPHKEPFTVTEIVDSVDGDGYTYPKYIIKIEEDVKQLWTELKLGQQQKEN
jgi:hypothetical protein